MSPLRILEARQVLRHYLAFEPPRHALEAGSIRVAFRMCTSQGAPDEGYNVHHATVLVGSSDSLALAFDQLRAIPHTMWAELPPTEELTFFDDALELSLDDCRLSLADPVSEICGLDTDDDDDPNHSLRHIRVYHEAVAPTLWKSISSAVQFGMQEHMERGVACYLPEARFDLYEDNSFHPADVPAVLSRTVWHHVYRPLAGMLRDARACRRLIKSLITQMRNRVSAHARAEELSGWQDIEQATAICLAVATNDADFCIAADGGEGAQAVFTSMDELVKCSLVGFNEGVWEAYDIQCAALFLPQLICALTECNKSYSEFIPAHCLDAVVDQARAVFLQSVLIDRSRPQASALELVPPELLRLALGDPALFRDLGTSAKSPGNVWLQPCRYVRGPA
mmetsp:Transcript_46771/g.77463  ORF Transcript_46771/g.77463 Transcript_46771/m.77463 type:complete len:395 (+) Transcript_46771:200-1384(+)|eukprot:CAMPEP_0119335462 /NCGR_PEP_ID=MMETSP1333-20130426/89653_1 /TAXON_ID=418940 /ORGANISM="Scyphosphaera apsteinii, Strain RCC1455" /LENGTH=394 /DNA_ID=CAMNT_0007346013 /DNA_START=193 /DNA_END=1377 /DNA_ORIENTATION=+